MRISEKDAIVKIEEYLNETYGSTFKVTMIHYDSDQNTYTAQVTEVNSYRFFTAVCDGKGNITEDFVAVRDSDTVIKQTLDRYFEKYSMLQFRLLSADVNRSLYYFAQLSQMQRTGEDIQLDLSELDDVDII